MQAVAVQCSAVQCSAVQCSAVQCSAVQCSAVQCSAVQCSARVQSRSAISPLVLAGSQRRHSQAGRAHLGVCASSRQAVDQAQHSGLCGCLGRLGHSHCVQHSGLCGCLGRLGHSHCVQHSGLPRTIGSLMLCDRRCSPAHAPSLAGPPGHWRAHRRRGHSLTSPRARCPPFAAPIRVCVRHHVSVLACNCPGSGLFPAVAITLPPHTHSKGLQHELPTPTFSSTMHSYTYVQLGFFWGALLSLVCYWLRSVARPAVGRRVATGNIADPASNAVRMGLAPREHAAASYCNLTR